MPEKVILVVKKTDKWFLNYKINSISGVTFDADITIREQNNSPNPVSVKIVEEYIKAFPGHWNEVYSKLIEFNSEYSWEEVKKSIGTKIFIYAPALVGATYYDLMLLLKLKSDIIQHQNCTFFYCDNKLVLSDQHM